MDLRGGIVDIFLVVLLGHVILILWLLIILDTHKLCNLLGA